MMRKALRVRMMVDPKLQGALLCRTLLYWIACVGVVLVLAALQSVWSGRGVAGPVLLGRTIMAFGPALIASVVVLPLMMFDALRFSNRFAGPMNRLQRQANRLAAGETVEPIIFRQEDFWDDLAKPFNQISAELTDLRQQVKEAEAAEKASCEDASQLESHV